MKWITNTFDPNHPDADSHVYPYLGEEPWATVKRHREWLSDKVIGGPEPSETYTVDQLKAMHMVGVYAVEESDTPVVVTESSQTPVLQWVGPDSYGLYYTVCGRFTVRLWPDAEYSAQDVRSPHGKPAYCLTMTAEEAKQWCEDRALNKV